MTHPPFPRPTFSRRGRMFVPAMSGIGYAAEAQSLGYAAAGMWAPGGALTPDTLYGVQILGLKRRGLPTDFMVALAGGGRPQDFFASVRVPGINGDTPLFTADAIVETGAYSTTPYTVWVWEGLPNGEVAAGSVSFA